MTNDRRIATFLMFEGDAEEAMNLYVSLFDDGEVLNISRYGADGPGDEGTVQHATFSLAGQQLMCIDSVMHHEFTFTPSTSLYVECRDEAEIDRLHAALADGGAELMSLDAYPFSTKFCWLNDRFGVSWQLNLA